MPTNEIKSELDLYIYRIFYILHVGTIFPQTVKAPIVYLKCAKVIHVI
jgi:hypothetical protein